MVEKGSIFEQLADPLSKIFLVAVLLPVISPIMNLSTRDDRTQELTDAAKAACKITSAADPEVAASVVKDCSASAADAIRDAYPNLDSRSFLYFKDSEGNALFERAKEAVRVQLPANNQAAMEKRIAWEKEHQQWTKTQDGINAAMADDIRNIVVGGQKPFAGAEMSFDIKSLIPIIAANGKETGVYTGKFSVAITDPGSSATRTFAYDHATGNVTQTMGETSGEYSFHANLDLISASVGGASLFSSGIASGGGHVSLTSTGSVDCDGKGKNACAVIATMHRALNGLSVDQRKALQALIAEPASEDAKKNEAYTYTALKF